MNRLLLFILSSFILTCCKVKTHKATSDSTPPCIKKSIETFSKTTCEKGLNVKEYTFQGKQVFVFDQNPCGNDMTSEVFDKTCKSLGFLGGFIGNVKINGEDFSNAVFVRTVWEKQ